MSIYNGNKVLKSAVTAATATTGGYDITNAKATGLLQPFQAKEFMEMVIDKSDFLSKITHEMRRERIGTFNKLGVGNRLFRGRVENVQTEGQDIIPIIDVVEYETKSTKAYTEISMEFFDENIEGQNFENKFLNLIHQQLAEDIVDLGFNGDESSTDSFIKINDGWIKLLQNSLPSNQLINAATINGGNFHIDYFNKLMKAVPPKYLNSNKYRWICNSTVLNSYTEWLQSRVTSLGDTAILNTIAQRPRGVEFEIVNHMPDDIIILADPKNFVHVTNYDIRFRSTDQGRHLVSRGNKFYVWFMDMDFIIMEANAVAMITNVGEVEA